MVLSASSPSALATTGSSYRYVTKQAISAVIGIVGMFFLSKIDYKKYAKLYKIIYVLSVAVLLLVLIPGIGRTVNGARRWISLPVISSFQPSELTKIGLIVFFAAYLTKHKEDLKKLGKGFIKTIAFSIIPLSIIFFVQSHFSASVTILVVLAIMMIVAGSKIIHFLSLGTIGSAAAAGLIFVLATKHNIGSFRITRITSFLNPWKDAQDSGWQIIQSLYAIGSGGLFGVGLRK